MFGLGTTELLIILGIVILLFGAKRIPELGKGIAQGIRGFQKGLKDPQDNRDDEDDSKRPSAQA